MKSMFRIVSVVALLTLAASYAGAEVVNYEVQYKWGLIDATAGRGRVCADINFMLQCCRFYLSLCNTSVKPLPPMKNIIIRKHRDDMGDNFQDWAETYFAPGSENLDKELDKKTAFEAYKTFSGVGKITMQGFTKKLKAFCALAPHIEALNPESRCNNYGRIIRTIDGRSTEMIYLESRKEPV